MRIKTIQQILLGIFLVVGIMSCVVSTTQASIPDFTVTDDIRSSVYVGEQQVGHIVVAKSAYLPIMYNLSTVTNITVQKFDKLRWSGAQSVQITSPSGNSQFVIANGDYTFTESGSFTIRNVNDASQIATITVTVEDPLIVDLSITNPSLDFKYETRLTVGTESNTYLNVSVDSGDDPKTYDATIRVFTSRKNITYTKQFAVQQDYNWTLAETTANVTYRVTTNTIQDAGYISFKHTGNSDVTVTSSVTGDKLELFKLQQSQLLKRNSVTFFPLTLQIPSTLQNGVYNETIRFTGGNRIWELNTSVVVSDLEPPKIISVNFSTPMVYHQTTVTVVASDNVNVGNVTMTSPTGLLIFDKDQQYFKKYFSVNVTGDYVFSVCAIDTNMNQACNSSTVRFGNLTIINLTTSVDMPPTKAGKFSRAELANFSEESPVLIAVRLRSFVTDSIQTTLDGYTVRLVDGSQRVNELTGVGDSAGITAQGILYVDVRGINTSTYSMILDFMLPDYMGGTQSVAVSGKFLTYDVPPPFERAWFANKNITCASEDTGYVNTSEIKCMVRFPITTDVDSISIPTSLNEKTMIDAESARREQMIRDREHWIFIVAGFGFAFALVLGLMVYYLAFIHPYFRYRFDKDQEKKS